ncbi:MAG: hypothetical protein US69_C0016G0009 [candidate division TM6 bacterium GW2011_GWF2_38_10]|nr:MAG: hypothetical protein US69_C0016G0009 [candidate division TM6 bacterium GW2011_GWF2_38_10]
MSVIKRGIWICFFMSNLRFQLMAQRSYDGGSTSSIIIVIYMQFIKQELNKIKAIYMHVEYVAFSSCSFDLLFFDK